MAKITLDGTPANTIGELPETGSNAPFFSLTTTQLTNKDLESFKGKKLILNILPSVETGVCSASARKFNQEASSLNNTKILCISKDLPFAQNRFCAAEGLDDVVMLSDFKDGKFGREYGVEILDGNFQGLLARAVVVLDENHKVIYSEQVPEIGQEPNYEKALNHLR